MKNFKNPTTLEELKEILPNPILEWRQKEGRLRFIIGRDEDSKYHCGFLSDGNYSDTLHIADPLLTPKEVTLDDLRRWACSEDAVGYQVEDNKLPEWRSPQKYSYSYQVDNYRVRKALKTEELSNETIRKLVDHVREWMES